MSVPMVVVSLKACAISKYVTHLVGLQISVSGYNLQRSAYSLPSLLLNQQFNPPDHYQHHHMGNMYFSSPQIRL